MKKILVFILALIPLMAAMPVRKGLPESAKGESHYDVRYNYGGIHAKMATATLTVGDATWQEMPAYFANFTIRAANVFKLFLLNEYKVNLFLSKDDSRTYYYSFPHRKKGKERHLEFFYKENEVESVLQTEGFPEPVRQVYATDGIPTMDIASFVFFLRSIDPAELKGEHMRANLIMVTESVPSELRYLGEDYAYWPGEGAYHYQVKMLGRGLMENHAGDVIDIWISPQPERLFRGLEVKLGKGTVAAKMVLPE